MTFSEHPRFSKEFKNLAKRRFRTLAKDLDKFRQAHQDAWTGQGSGDVEHRRNFFNKQQNAILHQGQDVAIVKARLYSKDLNNDSVRVIYCVALKAGVITLIEIYTKGDKPTEDETRWKAYKKS